MTALVEPRAALTGRRGRAGAFGEALAARGGVLLLAAALFVFLTLPLATLLVRALQDADGGFAGLANFTTYLQSPAIGESIGNTLQFAVITTLLTVPLAFAYAYAMQRSCIPAKAVWRAIALVPILAPSMLAALSFLYLFGNQGWLNFMLAWVGLDQIYGMR